MNNNHERTLVISAVVAVGAILVFGISITQKLERVVQAAERTEDKMNRIMEAVSPVGKAAVDKGVSVLQSVDEQALADSAEQGVKDVGAAARDKLVKWIDAQKASPTNREIPNVNVIINTEAPE